MSALTIKRALDRTLAQIPGAAEHGQAACEALLSGFFVELARDAADNVHLHLAQGSGPAGADKAIIENVGLALVQNLSETLQSYDVDGTRWGVESKALTTRTYYARLAELGVSPRQGGSA